MLPASERAANFKYLAIYLLRCRLNSSDRLLPCFAQARAQLRQFRVLYKKPGRKRATIFLKASFDTGRPRAVKCVSDPRGTLCP
eukprot:g45925.t1